MMESTESDLFAAIKAGEFERVKAMVSADPALVDAPQQHGRQRHPNRCLQPPEGNCEPAGRARRDADAVRSVRRRRIRSRRAAARRRAPAVNAYSDDGWTPLHLAAFFGHPKIAELLLAHGADVTARSRNANGNTPLHAALAANQKMVAGLLIGGGADVNAADADGWRPLHLAAANNNLEAMKALIAQGADVAAANGEGLTPLALAQENATTARRPRCSQRHGTSLRLQNWTLQLPRTSSNCQFSSRS